MINVVFKNLEKSELAKEAATERMESIVEKFPDLHSSQIKVTLEMQNSPHQAGPDFFVVKTQLNSGRYRGLRVEKSAQNLYVALAAVVGRWLGVRAILGNLRLTPVSTTKRSTSSLWPGSRRGKIFARRAS